MKVLLLKAELISIKGKNSPAGWKKEKIPSFPIFR